MSTRLPVTPTIRSGGAVIRRVRGCAVFLLALAALSCGSKHEQAHPAPPPAAVPRDARVLPMVDAPPHVVLTITATDVLVDGASVGAPPTSPGLQAKVRAALATTHAKILVIAGATPETSAVTISHIVDAARQAGYDQVLFDKMSSR